MENETYKKLYFQAFNCLTDLIKEIERIQEDLEEMYLEAEDHPEGNTDQ